MAKIIIDRSTPFNAGEFIGPGWTTVPGEEDARSLTLTEIDTNDIVLVWPEYDKVRVNGEDEAVRLAREGYIRLDAKILQVFFENKDCIPDLLKNQRTKGGSLALIFFDGTRLVDPQGRRFTFCLFFSAADKDWHWICCPMDADRRIFGPSALFLIDWSQ